jgi:hypothetical protein
MRTSGFLDASGCFLAEVPNAFLRNLLAKEPKSAGPFVATLVRSIFAQPDAAAVHAQFRRVVEQLAERFPPPARCSPMPVPISWRSLPSRRLTGAGSGRTIRRSD